MKNMLMNNHLPHQVYKHVVKYSALSIYFNKTVEGFGSVGNYRKRQWSVLVTN